jgi:hypothetical protein
MIIRLLWNNDWDKMENKLKAEIVKAQALRD